MAYGSVLAAIFDVYVFVVAGREDEIILIYDYSYDRMWYLWRHFLERYFISVSLQRTLREEKSCHTLLSLLSELQRQHRRLLEGRR